MIDKASFKRLILRAVLRHVNPMAIRQVAVSDQINLPKFNDIFCHLPSSCAWRISTAANSHFSGPIRVKLDVKCELPLVCSYESASISRTYGGATEAGTILRVKGQVRFPCTLATKITWEAGCAGKS
jgi:hypothetical protein